jgi:hypothetical protein
MSRVRADIFTNTNADGPPNFSNGVNVTGITSTSNLNVVGIVTASSFDGDGSNLTGIVGFSQEDTWLFGAG